MKEIKCQATIIPSVKTSLEHIEEYSSSKVKNTKRQKDKSTRLFIAILYVLEKTGNNPNSSIGNWLNKS